VTASREAATGAPAVAHPVLSVAGASALILDHVSTLGSETLPLAATLGRVLARDVRSPVALPPWDNASMDGYAVRAADVARATREHPIVLPVFGTIAAGAEPPPPLERGGAMRIMTGAPVPQGADTVIRVEDTDRGVERVTILDARDASRNVRPAGEDLAEGDVAVSSGTVIGPAQLGVLASVGAAMVEVRRVPRVGILASGDELVDLEEFDEVRRGRRIVSSNSYTMRASVALAGGEPVNLGIVGDDRELLRERFLRARAERCDMLLTSGGVSVGEFDFTREVLEQLGASMRLWRVRMRPGAPLGFGLLGDIPWIGLPGNPVSAMVTFELFVRPAIRRMRGEQLIFPLPVRVIADEEISIAAPLTTLLRAIVRTDPDGTRRARLTGPQGSGLLTSMARANALVVVPPERFESGPVAVGETLTALPLGDDLQLGAAFPLA
jgi:molybdopterin molybdotransferase